MREFGYRLSNLEQRNRWELELNRMAEKSADHKITYGDAWHLYEEIKDWQNY
jgi:hypothetical protein